jgi:hypothetical protein
MRARSQVSSSTVLARLTETLPSPLARHDRRRRAGQGVVSTLVAEGPLELHPCVRASPSASLDETWAAWAHEARAAARERGLAVLSARAGRPLVELASALARGDLESESLLARAISQASSELEARGLGEVFRPSVPPPIDLAQALSGLGAELPWLVFDAPDAAVVRWALRAVEAAPALRVALRLGPDALVAIEGALSLSQRDRLREGLVVLAGPPGMDARQDAAEDLAPFGPHLPALARLVPAWRAARVAHLEGPPDRARSLAERFLFDALEALPETRGAFRLNARLPGVTFGSRDVEIDLAALELGLAIEVDGPFHFVDAESYRRDRRKDVLLQRQSLLVVRVLASDVVERLAEVLDTILENVRHARRERSCP